MPPDKVAGNLTTSIPWGEFFDIITVPPVLAANDATMKDIVKMLRAHGRIADDAITAVRRKVDSKLDEVLDAVTTKAILAVHREVDLKLDKYLDSITAHFCTDRRESNTTINDKIRKEREQITEDITRKINKSLLDKWLVVQNSLLVVCQSFSDDLANTAKLLDITVKTMVADSGNLSTLKLPSTPWP